MSINPSDPMLATVVNDLDSLKKEVVKLAGAVDGLAREVVKLAAGKSASTANIASAATKAGSVKINLH